MTQFDLEQFLNNAEKSVVVAKPKFNQFEVGKTYTVTCVDLTMGTTKKGDPKVILTLDFDKDLNLHSIHMSAVEKFMRGWLTDIILDALIPVGKQRSQAQNDQLDALDFQNYKLWLAQCLVGKQLRVKATGIDSETKMMDFFPGSMVRNHPTTKE
jgi:hypothetical protein